MRKIDFEDIERQGIHTPFYFYDMRLLEKTLRQARNEADKYDFHLHYALKANVNTPLLKRIQELGFGADCVSGNEVQHALNHGFSASKIAFAGVGKTDNEIKQGLVNEIFSFNVESIPELMVINDLALQNNKIARIALRINPNVDANTHHYITTGIEESKFGINHWELDRMIEMLPTLTGINLVGLHFHIGSQITDFSAFKSLCLKVNKIQEFFSSHGIEFEHLNLGGGLGIDYHAPDENEVSDFKTYFALFNQLIHRKEGQEIHFELGRSLVAQCGSLITKVLFIKEGAARNFAIVDAGMNDLMRPALYQAYHQIQSLTSKVSDVRKYDVVGPICESTDIFLKQIALPQLKRGDILAIRSTGAYGQSMRNNYNMRKDAQEWYQY